MNEQDQFNCDYVIRAHQLCMDLNDIMMLINASHDIEEILHKVVEGSCKALGCESARIAMREGDNWVIRYVSNLPECLLGMSFTDEELPHAALAMETGKPVAIDDAFHDDRTNKKMMKALGIKSVIVLPLMEKSVITGTLLYGYHSKAVSFTDAKMDYAGRMATGVAIALQDARLYQELEESKRLGDALNEIDNVLSSSQDYDTIMRTMLQLATDVIGAESAVIFAREGERWKVRYEYKLPVSVVGKTFSNTEVMHTAITAITRKSLVSQDVLNDPHLDQKFVEMLGVRSLLDFPLIVKGEVVGDLTFHYHSSPIPFNERQVEFVRKLQIAISLALASERLLYTAQQSESKLKEAEILGKSGYFNYDVHTRKITWSEGMFHVFGRDPKLGEPTVEELFELYSVEPRLEAMSELVQNKKLNEFDAKIQRDDLSYVFHLVIRASKDANGNTEALFGTIQDITERKRDEEALRVSEQKMHFATTAADIGVWNWDLIANEVVWSDRCKELFGYPPDHTPYQAVMQMLHAEERQRADEIVHKALKEKSDYLAELRFELPDGQERWVMSKGHGFYDDQGNPVSMHGIVMDITSRKYAEQEIERLNMELSARAAELEAANEEMEAFNYTVAHDLRGPLNNTGLFFQTIKELCGEKIDEVCKEYLVKGFKSVQSMSQLIDVLLEFSKLSRVEPRRENFDLSAMVRELLDELKRTSPERTCVFHITDGIMVNADQKLLRVALNNLLRNAWKYTSKREEAVIEFGVTEIGGKQVCFVRDNGSGFDLADADKLFRPFQRLPGSEAFRGSGIGLATVERIIRRHGGKVWAEGEPGKGACFYFTLLEE